ncbi:dihydroorotase [Ilyobacter polytropus]|uniref:Dihydroorotase, multifunctional complex type n=1 Tax=Ilyobacter polytropus (strain ATCC 51220 / DSM 2926 / LMG 16218 / CuHBu1) TaxID=572544 RepID=E3HDQ9_ILYPC|nr:amidohydrolase family protein [Ilyobacter polytropus]ADO84245.1 dihydroorotase, multifunctional complex type [Ilyobacter polytropus DSM 2926]
MLIKNARLVLENGEETLRDILVSKGKIAEISKEISIEDAIKKVFKTDTHLVRMDYLDLEGRYLIPGVVDPHVHMRDPGLTHKESATTGSMACAKGGVTTFLDMPNTIPATITEEILDDKRDIFKNKTYVDYGFHFGAAGDNNSQEIKNVKNTASTKVFLNISTGKMMVENDEILNEIFSSSEIVSVHAEEEMVKKAISLSKKNKNRLYLCHLSLVEEVEELKKAKEEGMKVYGEVTPHHLFLNTNNRDENEQNSKLLIMKPELKRDKDNEKLWDALNNGIIDTVGTDHAPHLLSEKMEKTTFGIPGVEHSLEIMLKGIKEGKISMKRLIEVMSKNPAEIFNIKNKGKIKVGYDADFVEIDMNQERVIKREEVISKCGWSPYEGIKTGGTVLTTIVRGEIVYKNGNFKNKIGREVEFNG